MQTLTSFVVVFILVAVLLLLLIVAVMLKKIAIDKTSTGTIISASSNFDLVASLLFGIDTFVLVLVLVLILLLIFYLLSCGIDNHINIAILLHNSIKLIFCKISIIIIYC
jgi:hypothetical protein